MTKGRKPTLKDIAREANVSATTVSLVMRDKEPPRISPAIRKKVITIAERFNYRPNYIARCLVKNESRTIGVIIPTLLKPFYSELAQDIIERAQRSGYGIIACSVQGRMDDERGAIDDLIDRGVDGLIICSALRHDRTIYEMIEQGVHIVLANRIVDDDYGAPEVDYVGIDNKRGAFLAVQHLIKLGHGEIALIIGPQDTSTGLNRYLGAMAAFEKNGLKFNPALRMTGDFSRISGRCATLKLLKKNEGFTAIFAANDHMAIGVLEALRENGLQVPKDIAVVGFDDIEMAGLPGVDLTTISQKKATLGRIAVDTLIEKIKGKTEGIVKQVILSPQLIIRRSCGANRDREKRYTTILPPNNSQ